MEKKKKIDESFNISTYKYYLDCDYMYTNVKYDGNKLDFSYAKKIVLAGNDRLGNILHEHTWDESGYKEYQKYIHESIHMRIVSIIPIAPDLIDFYKQYFEQKIKL
jgi:hypothetical protein